MKKITSSAISALGVAVSFFSLATSVYAQSVCPTGQFANLCNLKLSASSAVAGNILTILLIVGVIISIFFVIWGGIRWIMSGGDKGKVESARGTITAAVVGLIIAFLAFFIVNVITLLFTGRAITAFTIPTLF